MKREIYNMKRGARAGFIQHYRLLTRRAGDKTSINSAGFIQHYRLLTRRAGDKTSINSAGFTLVEMIIYLAIVGMVLVSISYLILDIIGGQTKSDAGQEVNYNVRFISDQLNSDIAAAQDIGGLTSDTLNLNMATEDIIYSFDTASSTLVKKVGTGASTTINTSAVDVTGSFTNNSFSSRSRNVGINLEINYKNPDNLPDYNSSTTAAWSVELRGRR